MSKPDLELARRAKKLADRLGRIVIIRPKKK